MNILFTLALLSSFVGPWFYNLVARHTKISRFLDGLVMTTIVGLVATHVLPESLAHLGAVTYFAVLLGLLGPLLWSKMLDRHECEIQKPFLVITILGLLAHNLLDGAALIIHPEQERTGYFLAAAVIAHRALASMALWRTFVKSLGTTTTSLILVGLSIAMSIGYFTGDYLLTHLHMDILHVLQSLACGMLIHVLLHPHHLKELFADLKQSHVKLRFQSLGAFCGILIAVLAYLFWPAHSHTEPSGKEHHHERQ